MSTEFDLEQYWEKEVLEDLSRKVSAISFDVWIKTLKPEYLKGNVLVLSSPSASSQKLVQKNYKTTICESLAATNRGITDVEILVADLVDQAEKPQKETKAPVVELRSSVFNPKFTFDNFVVGSSNRFAYASALAVAEEPGAKFNPLFIYGGVGLGKTHLLHAIGNHILQNHPEMNVVYTTTEKFTNELIESIQSNKKGESSFRNKYRKADVLIIDDIQFIISKTSTQEEFFHTFNELIQNGKQVIISSDKPPHEINPLEERLRSRFEWGLLSDIGFPDVETRIAILNKKAELERYNVSREVVEFIAQKVRNNIREMEGYLARTVFYSNLLGKNQATLDDAKEALKNLGESEEDKQGSGIDAIIDSVCKFFGIKRYDLMSRKRNRDIVEARQICMYIACENSDKYPISYVGERFGKDHATVIYARDKIKKDLKKNESLKACINDIKNLINGK